MLDQVADTITDKPVILTVDVLRQGYLHGLLQKFGIIPKQKVFEVKQITLGNLARISKLLLEVDVEFKDGDKWTEQVYQAMVNHGERLANIAAIALYNRKAYPPQSLVGFVQTNFTAKELLGVFNIIVNQMNVGNFILSIVSIKGANVLQTSQQN